MRRTRIQLRAALCRRSTVIKVSLSICACLMFYTAYRLFAGVIEQKKSAARPPSYLLCKRGGGSGAGYPCEDDKVSWTNRDSVWPDSNIPDSGDAYTIPAGAQLFLGTYKSPHRMLPPLYDSYSADGLGSLGRAGSQKQTQTGGSSNTDRDSVEDSVDDGLWAVNLFGEMKSDGETEIETESGRKGRRKGVVPVPVVVVEEHHEVIPYWFQALQQGLVPPQGNVLVHIDAHADTSVPTLNTSFPLFRRPELKELVHLMQRNDMFVMGAGLTGLFSRYIWIIPPWDTTLSRVVGPTGYNRYDVFAGFVIDPEDSADTYDEDMEDYYAQDAQQSNDQLNPEVCFCVEFENQDVVRSSQCFAQGKRTINHVPPVINRLIFREQCQPQVYAVAEVVLEDKAIELMNFRKDGRENDDSVYNDPADFRYPEFGEDGLWLGKQESVILDIDEDYYGVEAAITPLYNASLNDNVVDTVSEMVSRIFCARNAQQEMIADRIFTELIDSVHKDLLFCQQHQCATEFHSVLNNFSTKLNRDLRKNSVSQLLCDHHGHVRDSLVDFLISHLFFLSSRQLLAFGQVGICLKESPRTLGFNASLGMKVCTGYNRPGNSVVTFHVPDGAEVAERSQQLRKLLQGGQFTPRIITLARSVRDGYTPRGLFRKIEEEVMTTLKSVYHPWVSENGVVHDSQLWGGPGGRVDRTATLNWTSSASASAAAV